MTLRFQLLLGIALAASPAAASTIQLTGNLNDSGDPGIFGPGINGAGALFDSLDPSVSVNNIVLYSFTLESPASIHFSAPGADGTRIDPYLSLFAGSGSSATFQVSYFGAAFGDPIDATRSIGAGDYVVALSAFLNQSFAENTGVGTLGDGFIGLATYTGGTGYDLRIDTETVAVPEPGPAIPLAVGLLLFILRRPAA
ncbi:MAG: DVUA0089 family protein [Bryobacterales bacterium]|nr:DVUA0089 family protein [Bryobacterales bacterium]